MTYPRIGGGGLGDGAALGRDEFGKGQETVGKWEGTSYNKLGNRGVACGLPRRALLRRCTLPCNVTAGGCAVSDSAPAPGSSLVA